LLLVLVVKGSGTELEAAWMSPVSQYWRESLETAR
jgi:hypothetical protein